MSSSKSGELWEKNIELERRCSSLSTGIAGNGVRSWELRRDKSPGGRSGQRKHLETVSSEMEEMQGEVGSLDGPSSASDRSNPKEKPMKWGPSAEKTGRTQGPQALEWNWTQLMFLHFSSRGVTPEDLLLS